MEQTNSSLDSLKEMEKTCNKLISTYQQKINVIEQHNVLLKASPEEHSLSNKEASDLLDDWVDDIKMLCEMLEEKIEDAK